jgi:hypothetical protein
MSIKGFFKRLANVFAGVGAALLTVGAAVLETIPAVLIIGVAILSGTSPGGGTGYGPYGIVSQCAKLTKKCFVKAFGSDEKLQEQQPIVTRRPSTSRAAQEAESKSKRPASSNSSSKIPIVVPAENKIQNQTESTIVSPRSSQPVNQFTDNNVARIQEGLGSEWKQTSKGETQCTFTKNNKYIIVDKDKTTTNSTELNVFKTLLTNWLETHNEPPMVMTDNLAVQEEWKKAFKAVCPGKKATITYSGREQPEAVPATVPEQPRFGR